MIVSQRTLDEAAASLGGLDLATLTEPVLQKVYKDLAKVLHPDKGGDAAKFVEVDRAKCILAGWLASKAKETPASAAISSNTCPMCHGTGRRSLQRGFRSMTMICGTCRGLGEIVPPEKVDD